MSVNLIPPIYGICSKCFDFRQVFSYEGEEVCIECIPLEYRYRFLLQTPLMLDPNLSSENADIMSPKEIGINEKCPKCKSHMIFYRINTIQDFEHCLNCSKCDWTGSIYYFDEG